MKKINIFLASSIVEFKNERAELENFIRNVSDDFEDRYNIKLQPLLCENFDDAYTTVRKQEEYNQKIRESDFCFFIFFTKVGEYTLEEFNVAEQQFKTTGKPKIYTYFKTVEDSNVEQSVYDFMNQLDKTFSHYYGKFSHIDTVKLRILLSLKLQEMDFVEIKLEGGNAIVDGSKIMSVANVSEFANNENLEKMQNELNEVEKEYYQLKPLYDKNNNDAIFYKRYSEIASRRQYLIDEIEELQKLIFNVSLRMVEDEVHGTITERQRSAYKLFEQGDYEGCLSVLDSDDIEEDFQRNMKRLENERISICKKYIKEHKTAIDILISMRGYEKRFEEIEGRYEKIIPLILDLKIETDTAKDYVSYLIDQNKDNIALPIAEQLIKICDKKTDIASIHTSLGIIYKNLNDPSNAQEHYLNAIKIREELAIDNPEQYIPDLAMSYNNAGVFYNDQGQPQKAEKYHLDAIAIREKLAIDNPEQYIPDLATSYNNAGNFYNDQGQPHKAERYYLDAIAIREKLANDNPERYNPDLATSYNNAGVFYKDQDQPQKAEKYYLDAIAIREKLAIDNPERYNPNLAMSYYNAGIFYYVQGQPQKAEKYYLDAIDIYKKLANDNPTLAASYNAAGVFYENQGQPNKAEKYYLDAIEIFEKLANDNPKQYNSDLAGSYNNAGVFYKNQGQPQKAEKYYLDAIEIFEKLAIYNPERYNPDLAISYYNYGIFKNNDEFSQKALELAKTRPDHPICKQIISKLE